MQQLYFTDYAFGETSGVARSPRWQFLKPVGSIKRFPLYMRRTLVIGSSYAKEAAISGVQ